MSDARTPEEIAGGFIRVRVGDSLVEIPTLKLRAERAWRTYLAQTVGSAQVNLNWRNLIEGGDAAFTELQPLMQLPMDVALELVTAYDVTGALGGRDWAEEHFDSSQLYELLIRMCRVVFPFADDLRSVLMEVPALLQLAGLMPDEQPDQSKSPNGRLPTGDSDPTTSKEPSTANN